VGDVFRVEVPASDMNRVAPQEASRVAWAVVVLFVLINGIVLWNAAAHDPKIGYDAGGHLSYARTLATGRLPGADDTHEFFSPPLPYVPAALAMQVVSQTSAFKLTQFMQAGCSVVFCWCLLRLAKDMGLDGVGRAMVLLLIGSLPAYYRTFAMIRGEPWLVTLVAIGTLLTMRAFVTRTSTVWAGAAVGLTLGLAVASRQWAFFLLPALGAVGLWRLIVDSVARGATLRAGLATLLVFAMVGGPFYLHLQRTYGSVKAFNRQPLPEDEQTITHPRLPMSDALKALTTRPIRDVFNGHPFLLFYADAWGDYWQYFLVYGQDARGRYVKPTEIGRRLEAGHLKRSNRAEMATYFGRSAVVGLIPTALAGAGLAYGLWSLKRVPRRLGADSSRRLLGPVLALAALFTMAGYAWFVYSYPNDNGDTIKASYPLQLYGPLALLAAAMVQGFRQQARLFILTVLFIVFAHSLTLALTRYSTL
jgi:hypothetical protein